MPMLGETGLPSQKERVFQMETGFRLTNDRNKQKLNFTHWNGGLIKLLAFSGG